VKAIVQSWYREMAKRFHPDRTLDNGAVMKAINAAYERLEELLGV
jgi:DnaJ-class molecular chaperone